MDYFPFLLLFGQGCMKDESTITDCTTNFLIRHDMIPFSGNEVSGCSLFAELFIYKGKQYYNQQIGRFNLNFSSRDVKYLIIDNKLEINKFIEILYEINKNDIRSVTELIACIITKEQILDDF